MSQTAPASRLPYRDELDGLRAVAVLAVLGYHAGYNDFGGGFVGVDVFLVLSGYLITQQVISLHGRGGFSLGLFWLRRARRLVPALLPVLALSLVSALVLKGDAAFREFLGQAVSAGFFVSNYLFLSQADYFAPASDTNLLLHTWSLSLEMQFYLLMPLILIALGRTGAVVRIAALCVLVAASILLAEILIRSGRESWAFFGILPRFWEFALGGIVALLPRMPGFFPWLGTAMRALGLGLILWTVGGYAGGPFPGLGALAPVLGTALILAAPGIGRDPLRWLLESRGMRWIGLRSYAIYLVHWPLYVSVTPSAMNRSEDVLSVALLASIFLGHLIFRHVERPVRESVRFATPRAMARGALASGFAIAATAALLFTQVADVLRSSLPLAPMRSALTDLDQARIEYLSQMEALDDAAGLGARGLTFCSYDAIDSADAMLDCLSAAPRDAVLLIGDSHGRDTLLALEAAFPGQSFAMMHQSSCVSGRYFYRGWCFETLPEVLSVLAGEGRLDRVILSSRWGYGFHVHGAETLRLLAELGADVVLIGPGPTFAPHVEEMIARAALAGDDLAETAFVPASTLAYDVDVANRELAAAAVAAQAGYLDRFALFCGETVCRVALRGGGGFAYFDNEHLTLRGIAEFATDLARDPALRRLIVADGAG